MAVAGHPQRAAGADPLPDEPDAPSRARAWLRSTAPLPDDPLLHACVLACISDLTLLSVVLVPHGIPPRHEGYAGRLARPPRLVPPDRAGSTTGCSTTRRTPSMSDALGLAQGRMLTADGTLVASVAQEGLFRKEAGDSSARARTAGPRRAGPPRR